jgi:hypothetical protein
MVFTEDGYYKLYSDIDGDETLILTGSWSISNNMLTMLFDKMYDEATEELLPIEDGDLEKQEISFSVNEEQLILMSLLGGDTETLIGTWSSSTKHTNKGSSEVNRSIDLELIFKEDSTYELNITNFDDTQSPPLAEINETGTWEYVEDELFLNPSTTPTYSATVLIVGEGIALTSDSGTHYFALIMNKIE